MSRCHETFPRVICMIDYTLDEAILFYRQLFYSASETIPSGCDLNELLDRVDQSAVQFYPVIVAYGGAFETKHLRLIQCAFPSVTMYLVDTLHEDMDLLVCNLNEDETKWCFIPVFSSTNELDRHRLIESIRQELEGASSIWHGMEIKQLRFFLKFDHLQVYDPYTEILGLKKIHFVDTVDKCQERPCCLFRTYPTLNAIPSMESLVQKGLIDPRHTTIDVGCISVKQILTYHRRMGS